MNAADTIWTALGILMVVCVSIDSGWTLFNVIQVFQLAEDFLFIAFPVWSVWSAVFALNLPLEIACIFGTNRYKPARVLMGVHVAIKFYVISLTFRHIDSRMFFWATHYLNQVILVVLLASSIQSFFTSRSTYARKYRQSARVPSRSTSKPTPTSSTHQIAFVRGLY